MTDRNKNIVMETERKWVAMVVRRVGSCGRGRWVAVVEGGG